MFNTYACESPKGLVGPAGPLVKESQKIKKRRTSLLTHDIWKQCDASATIWKQVQQSLVAERHATLQIFRLRQLPLKYRRQGQRFGVLEVQRACTNESSPCGVKLQSFTPS